MRSTFQRRYAMIPYIYTEARRTYDTAVQREQQQAQDQRTSGKTLARYDSNVIQAGTLLQDIAVAASAPPDSH